uniref:Uncharacterized protein n=1 Tax=Avena sativa TaxID=4498 RepID=A0ACD5X0P5_AVESA
MIYASWNIRGVQADGRETTIVDTFNKHKPNIIGFQETKKETISNSYLKILVSSRFFEWRSLPANGSVGGILMGVDLDMFDIISWDIKVFSISVIVRHKALNTDLRFINVYGSSYEDQKYFFISELHSLFVDYSGHTIIGGDFNLVRFQEDKSNGLIYHRWSDKFNAWIDIWGLLEVKLSCRNFTWGNNQDNLIMYTFDKFFCNPELV